MAVGRVGQDPELRYFESGSVKCRVSLAVDPPYKSEKPLWYDLELWGKVAEVAANYVRKGSTIAIAGELKLERWTDKIAGSPMSKLVIKVNNLELLSRSRTESEPELVAA